MTIREEIEAFKKESRLMELFTGLALTLFILICLIS